MTRNTIYLIIGALIVTVVVLAYALYREQQTSGIEINLDKDRISIEEK